MEAPHVFVIIFSLVMAVADVKAVFQDNDRTVLIAVVRQQCLADDAEVFVQNHNRTGPTAETPNVLLVLFWIDSDSG